MFHPVKPRTALALAFLWLLAPPPAAAHPGGNGRIAFTRVEEADPIPKVFVVPPAGGVMSELLVGLKDACSDGVWSPDGSRFALTRAGGEPGSELFVLQRGQALMKRITTAQARHPGARASAPDWAPDGVHLAYEVAVPGQPVAVWGVGADGSGETLLFPDASAPRWSPDPERARIAFVRNRQIWVRDLAEGRERQVTPGAPGTYPVHVDPAWSPDGSRLACTRIAPGQVSRSVWVMDADGGHPFRLTGGQANDDQPEWSPDGKLIVFVSDRDGAGRGTNLFLRSAVAGDQAGGEARLTLPGRPVAGQGVHFGSHSHPRWESLRPPALPPRPHAPAGRSKVVAPPGGAPAPDEVGPSGGAPVPEEVGPPGGAPVPKALPAGVPR